MHLEIYTTEVAANIRGCVGQDLRTSRGKWCSVLTLEATPARSLGS
jgi:hypothetical protein